MNVNYPPSGQRVVLGRETTPTPGMGVDQPQRIPQEVWEKYEGKSREVINFVTYVESQHIPNTSF